MASWRWVRPVLTTSQNSSAFAASAAWSAIRAGISSSSIATAPDSWSAVGMVSLEDWHLLTSSLGWTLRAEARRREVRDDLVHVGVGRGARARLVDVDRELECRAHHPRPRGRRPRSPRPSGHRAGPRARFVSAAATLISARARRKRRGIGWPEIGKLRTARCVDAPYRASAGTSTSPMESRSIRVAGRSPPSLLLTFPMVPPGGQRAAQSCGGVGVGASGGFAGLATNRISSPFMPTAVSVIQPLEGARSRGSEVPVSVPVAVSQRHERP